MAEEHEINRLTVLIENANNIPTKQRLESSIKRTLEEYFDRFAPKGVDAVFDRIELDFGEIPLDSFEEELDIRLRFLLAEELDKFFDSLFS